MQDIATYCPTLLEHETMQLVDKRDDQEYTIFKAKDGNCWMGENLRYGSTPDNAPRAYVASDGDLSDNIDTTKMANLTTARICTTDHYDNACKTPGGAYMFYLTGDNYTMPYIAIYQANSTGYQVDPTTWASEPDKDYKFGVLYNYCAATGGTVCDSAAMSADASGSICPANWKLPGMTDNPTSTDSTATAIKDGSVKTYDNLLNNYNIHRCNNNSTCVSAEIPKLTADPLDFVRAGQAHDEGIDRYGGGSYWASTIYTNTSYAYSLVFSGKYLYRNGIRRYRGYSVRCVAS